jgi:hypothetical protein
LRGISGETRVGPRRRRGTFRFAGALLAALVLGASPGAALAGPSPVVDPIPEPIAPGEIAVGLERLASGFVAPVWATHASDGSGRLFIADMFGLLYARDPATGLLSLFLDVSARLVPFLFFEERGFVGIAFHPDYLRNGLLYTFTGEPYLFPGDFVLDLPAGTFPDSHSVIIEWRVPDPGNPAAVVDPLSARVLMRIEQPQLNHNGGCLVFGPDGMLYISLGDGGSGEDEGPGHGPIGNGQDIETVLGSILRIDVNGRDSANGQYGIPPDNPFVGKPGLDEIYAYGFRNPYRVSFDSLTGDFYIADVGQYDLEEVSLGRPGGNFGWNLKEGSFYFISNGPATGYVTDVDPGVPPGLIDPIAQYDHDEGVAVIGGFVYRGRALPRLRGRYVFGELLTRLFYLDEQQRIRELNLLDAPPLGTFLLGFGEDEDGELYVMTNGTAGPFGLTGELFKIVPPDSDGDGLRDHVDNCPNAFNPDQTDGGGVGPGSGPDGTGNVCQCGDVDGDGFVTKADGTAVRAWLAPGRGAPLARPELCDVNGDGACTGKDAHAIGRAQPRPGKADDLQRCPPAVPAGGAV